MKNTLLTVAICTLSLTPFVATSLPTPGCADLTPPGSWSITLSEYGDEEFILGDGATYGFRGMIAQVPPATTGQWDSVEAYTTQVVLSNVIGAPWYSVTDTNLTFEVDGILLIKARGTLAPSSNPAPPYVEIQLSAHNALFLLLMTYAGNPTITDFPANPDAGTGAARLTSAPFTFARVCVADPFSSNFPPLAARHVASPGPYIDLSWRSSTNTLCQLQTSSDVPSNQWADWGAPIAGTGADHHVLDPILNTTARRFYRLLQFP